MVSCTSCCKKPHRVLQTAETHLAPNTGWCVSTLTPEHTELPRDSGKTAMPHGRHEDMEWIRNWWNQHNDQAAKTAATTLVFPVLEEMDPNQAKSPAHQHLLCKNNKRVTPEAEGEQEHKCQRRLAVRGQGSLRAVLATPSAAAEHSITPHFSCETTCLNFS